MGLVLFFCHALYALDFSETIKNNNYFLKSEFCEAVYEHPDFTTFRGNV